MITAGEAAGDFGATIRKLRADGSGGTPVSLGASLVLFLVSDASQGLTGRLISAPHDPWQAWGPREIEALMRTRS